MSLQDLSLWGWSKQQMGDGFASSNTRRVLDCAARWSLGWWRVQAPFPHLLFTHGQPDPSPPLQAPEEPNKIISLCSRWLPLPPKAFLSLFFFCCPPCCHLISTLLSLHRLLVALDPLLFLVFCHFPAPPLPPLSTFDVFSYKTIVSIQQRL